MEWNDYVTYEYKSIRYNLLLLGKTGAYRGGVSEVSGNPL